MKDDVDEETKKARLAIVDATTKVIKTALGLLGIETVESNVIYKRVLYVQ